MGNEIANTSFGEFEYHDDGFTIKLPDKKRKVVWAEIESINTYNVDMITYETICIDIILENTYITLTEDIVGWKYFEEKLQLQFLSIDKDWFWKVAFPTFEKNFTTIYTRE